MTRCNNYDGYYVSPICDENEASIVLKNVRSELHSYEYLEQL